MTEVHHRGTMQMVGDVLAAGIDVQLCDFANRMAVRLSNEIRRLNDL